MAASNEDMRRIRVLLLLAALVSATVLIRSPRPRPALPLVPPSAPAEAAALDVPSHAAAPDVAPPPDAEEEEPTAVEPLLTSMRWLLANQNADGSWGDARATLEGVEIDRPGLTGLALLCMLGSGYSHLSKETYDGRCIGTAVKTGLKRLIDDQDVGGFICSSRSCLDQAIAAFALAEAYGLTGSGLFKDPAQRAVDGLVRLQLRDGSWSDSPTTAWAVEALTSARAGDLGVSISVIGALLGYYDRRRLSDAAEVVARIELERQKQHPAIAEAVDRILAEEAVPSLHQLYFRSRALRQVDAPSGPAWKAWTPAFKTALAARSPLSGAGLSELTIRAALGELCAGFGYTYVHVFSSK